MHTQNLKDIRARDGGTDQLIPPLGERQVGGSVILWIACATELVPGQPGLHRETLSYKKT